jgi:selenide,water dikinase
MKSDIKLTAYSHGAGCGCKLSPAVLDLILSKVGTAAPHANLLVGNSTKDDAAVYDLGDGTAIISTTDFFMPIVDDPTDFGKIAATNAISDIYAMGGTPLLAIAILGWPLDKLDPAIAGDVLQGGQSTCEEAGIALAGGHSIDSPEPIFGLAVTGRVPIVDLKYNSTARAGDLLYLTKGLGVGMITTAQKKGLVAIDHLAVAVKSMQTLNRIGADLAKISGVSAMTDVTGFGLLGHLVEMCTGADLSAEIDRAAIPQLLPGVLEEYHRMGAIPGGTKRNYASYGQHVVMEAGFLLDLLCDPQTSGGLLVAVDPAHAAAVEQVGMQYGMVLRPIGRMGAKAAHRVHVV